METKVEPKKKEEPKPKPVTPKKPTKRMVDVSLYSKAQLAKRHKAF